MIESLLFYSFIIIKKEEKPFIVQTTKFGLREVSEIVRTFIKIGRSGSGICEKLGKKRNTLQM